SDRRRRYAATVPHRDGGGETLPGTAGVAGSGPSDGGTGAIAGARGARCGVRVRGGGNACGLARTPKHERSGGPEDACGPIVGEAVPGRGDGAYTAARD